MIPKITSGSDFYGLIEYNELKEREGAAQCIGVSNIISDNPHQIIDTLEYVSSKNTRVKQKTFHASLNFPPQEKLENDELFQIAQEYMASLGYGEQPFVVYRHDDTENRHIHIISTRVNWQGKRIQDHQELIKSMKICDKIQQDHNLIKVDRSKKNNIYVPQKIDTTLFKGRPRQVKTYIQNIISHITGQYNLTDISQFKVILSQYNIDMGTVEITKEGQTNTGVFYYLTDKDKKQITKSIPASNIRLKQDITPTIKYLEKYFDNSASIKNESIHTIKPKIASLNDFAYISHDYLDSYLKKNNLELKYHTNSSGIYGISFFDTKNQCFYKGSELNLPWSKIKDKLNDNVTFKSGNEFKYLNILYTQFISQHNENNPTQKPDRKMFNDFINQKINNPEILDHLSKQVTSISKRKKLPVTKTDTYINIPNTPSYTSPIYDFSSVFDLFAVQPTNSNDNPQQKKKKKKKKKSPDS